MRTTGKPVPALMLPAGSPHAAHGRGVLSVVGQGADALDSVVIKSSLLLVRASGCSTTAGAISFSDIGIVHVLHTLYKYFILVLH